LREYLRNKSKGTRKLYYQNAGNSLLSQKRSLEEIQRLRTNKNRILKNFTKQNINPNPYELHVKVCKEWERKKPSIKKCFTQKPEINE
jgi:hypothetical protein